MINRKAIYNTAFSRWDNENECYVVESPLFDRVLGVAESEGEAWKIYASSLEDAYEELKKDNVAGYKRGRPVKGGVEFHCQIRPQTKLAIDECRESLGLSQGEFVDVAVFFFKQSKRQHKGMHDADSAQLYSRLEKFARLLNQAAVSVIDDSPVRIPTEEPRSVQRINRTKKVGRKKKSG